ncbi:GNAT family N-acetyltransferase [Leuconostoc pseudomesenteroides]|uniref:GNAT family N-acetyltransferase n=1 Tax=Leuconostoc pseudomesenteroides TaxID=33968 RepID=UPI0016636DA9|nr:GNAT family N-acetyltransferase [Leuconostoc pseudomesenteroides]
MIKTVAITPSNFEQILALDADAFGYPVGTKTMYRRELVKNATVYGDINDDTITSQVFVLPLHVKLNTETVKMVGIGNVASYPEVRGNGAIRRIMAQIQSDAYEDGAILSYLAPFSYRFYRQFGYEWLFDQKQYTWDDHTVPIGAKTTPVKRLSFDEALPTMKKIIGQHPDFQFGALVRDDWWWRFRYTVRLSDLKIATTKNGYVMYRFESEKLIIQELVTLTHDAELALWRFISSRAGTFKQFQLTDGQTRDWRDLSAEPMAVKIQQQAGMMVRIVNIAALLRILALPVEMVIDVTDDFEQNAGHWQINGERSTATAQLSGTVQAWTKVLLHARRAEILLQTGELHGDIQSARRLDQVIDFSQRTVLADYF